MSYESEELQTIKALTRQQQHDHCDMMHPVRAAAVRAAVCAPQQVRPQRRRQVHPHRGVHPVDPVPHQGRRPHLHRAREIAAAGEQGGRGQQHDLQGVRRLLPAVVHRPLLPSNSAQGLQHAAVHAGAAPHRLAADEQRGGELGAVCNVPVGGVQGQGGRGSNQERDGREGSGNPRLPHGQGVFDAEVPGQHRKRLRRRLVRRFLGAGRAVRNGDRVCERVPARRHLRPPQQPSGDPVRRAETMRRPAPRQAASIGAWLSIFQNLGVVAIVTNCALLVCLYDDAGRWKIEPGLAAILLLEHLLLLAKFGFSWFVAEEPSWLKARRIKKAYIRDYVSHRLLGVLEEEPQQEILRAVQDPPLPQ